MTWHVPPLSQCVHKLTANGAGGDYAFYQAWNRLSARTNIHAKPPQEQRAVGGGLQLRQPVHDDYVSLCRRTGLHLERRAREAEIMPSWLLPRPTRENGAMHKSFSQSHELSKQSKQLFLGKRRLD